MAFRRLSLVVAFAVVPSLLLAGCGSEGATLSSIVMTPSPVRVAVGGTRQLVVTGSYSDGTRAPVTSGVAFSTSAGSVAAVNSSGLVTGIGGGNATVTAQVSGLTATVTVVVASPPVIDAFTATPDTIDSGASSLLAWRVTGAETLTIDPPVGTVTVPSGSASVSPPQTTTYTLTATNAAGVRTATATVTVNIPPGTWPAITFDSTSVTYTLTGFGGAEDSTVVPGPAGSADTTQVARVVKSATAEVWAGTTVSTGANQSVPTIPFAAGSTTMTVRVYSPDAGIKVRLKVEDAANAAHTCETEATTTVANAWETLTFNFANPATGTAALDFTFTYNKISIFFNFGVAGATAGAKTYYFDDIAK